MPNYLPVDDVKDADQETIEDFKRAVEEEIYACEMSLYVLEDMMFGGAWEKLTEEEKSGVHKFREHFRMHMYNHMIIRRAPGYSFRDGYMEYYKRVGKEITDPEEYFKEV